MSYKSRIMVAPGQINAAEYQGDERASNSRSSPVAAPGWPNIDGFPLSMVLSLHGQLLATAKRSKRNALLGNSDELPLPSHGMFPW